MFNDAARLRWSGYLVLSLLVQQALSEQLPHDPDLLQQEARILPQVSHISPHGVRKMSDDAGEKFWLHYYDFEVAESSFNESSPEPPSAAIAPHAEPRSGILPAVLGRALLRSRDFQCPSMTDSCSDIGSDLCCPSGQACINVSGGVGCCPSGQSCGDSVGACDTAAGYSSCPHSSNGGCCIPGAKCEANGCIFYGTSIIVAPGSTRTVTESPTSSATSSTTSTTSTGSQVTKTVTVTQTVGGQVITVISATTIFTSSSSSATASAAIRPTSVSTSSTEITTSSTASITSQSSAPAGETSCPTGYYMCSAVYLGGCCRVDRNCDTMSCPSTAQTTIVTSAPTIAVPVGTGSCANGWLSCASSAGGGCCPSGYLCGASCTATVTGEPNTAKMAPESSGNAVRVCLWYLLAFLIGTSMMFA